MQRMALRAGAEPERYALKIMPAEMENAA